ncbi:MAG: endolytic transglycosylase MltG [Chloroflexi bacterium]|nr:endolytic transglycosylase MltG [Chloroflexota bacterium]
MTAPRVLVVLFALVILGVGGGLVYYLLSDAVPLVGPSLSQAADPLAPADPQATATEVFTVPPGASASSIGDALQHDGLVRSGLAFKLLAEREGVGDQLTAGDYDLSPAMSSRQIMDAIVQGQVRHGPNASIPEGWRAEQIADRLDAVGLTSRDDFLQAVANPSKVAGSDALGGPLPPTLEGYLFPDHYEVKSAVSGSAAAELMVRTFNERVGPELRDGAAGSGLNPRELLTLASIVEREASVPQERPIIASVYLNRLHRDMPLQADPTVQYAIATRDGAAAHAYGYWKPSLSPADLKIDSPFNTYDSEGLPPGPICNPGEDSIRAVLQPAQTDYLYFVARDDGSGSHLFARTLDEHNQNVEQVDGSS